MEMALQQGKDQLARLVAHFRSHRDYFHSPHYKEAHVRQELIDPFFIALGWDVRNERRVAPQYREVVTEESLDIEGHRKAPDYVFRVGQTPKFYAEAKKPGVAIKSDPAPAYQLRRYGWSAKLPLSVLTDFEELAVYDCRIRPRDTDKASAARIHYLGYDEYPDRWSELWDLFSREAVWAGSFDRFAQAARGKRGTGEVDTEFLKEIETWRDVLARNIALRNARLSIDELNDAVQRTIDRVIFLRMAEDRGMEPYEQLRQLAEGKDIYKSLVRELYHKADEKYNSGLFDFAKDTLTPRLAVDDRVLKPIITSLYFPRSPYEFSVLPAEILGNVYEQFLGKVIRLTPGHQAKVEDKPEVKKAGGVYYTPAYIVEFIVKNTVGKMTEGKSPRQLEGFRVLDMACGSGSFLLRAYQCLLDHHLSWYLEHDPDKHPRAVWQHRGQWRLTTAERKRILIAHIFGVDIDRQAVEVTKLSLLLKVLEGETDETLGEQSQLTLWEDRALPDLDQNVKCGNSLIGPDYFTDQLLPDPDELRRINPFDWNAEFPSPCPSPGGRGIEGEGPGGFDCVIGNPPYGALFGETEASYFSQRYTAFSGVRDVYTCFIERGLSRVREGGALSYIIPSAWLGGPQYEALRTLLLPWEIETVILLPFDVFAAAYVDTAVFVVSKVPVGDTHKVTTYVYGKREKITQIALSQEGCNSVRQEQWKKADGKKFVLDPSAIELLDRIRTQCSITLGDAVAIKRGVLFDRGLLTKKRTSKSSFRYFEGDVYRYRLNLVADSWVEFGDKMKERPKESAWFDRPRILLRRLVNRRQRLMATFAADAFISNKNLYSILPKAAGINLLAVLGVLNSRLFSYLYIKQVTQATKDDFPQVTIRDLLALPFPPMADKARHDRMVALVKQMLELHRRLHAAETSAADRELLQRQIDATDREIDRLVYDLYALTEEEIAVIEGRPTS